eukprot:365417-Chlamydomonas_euryale.AAC.20
MLTRHAPPLTTDLRIAIEEARREALALRQDASTSGSTAAGTAPADIPSLEGVEALASALEGSGAGMEALMALADQEEVVAQLLEEAQAVNECVGGGGQGVWDITGWLLRQR